MDPRFIPWFQQNGGFLDVESVGFTMFPESEGGRGAVALKDIPEGHLLFSIPRELLLSTETSALPNLLGEAVWGKLRGWNGLMLCMMYEFARGNASKWFPYLSILPREFDTPMFWTVEELMELEGTSIIGKLGKVEADKAYAEIILPILHAHPNVFPPSLIPQHYSVQTFHVMGSLILSRSFSVEKASKEHDDPTKMDVDIEGPESNEELGPEAEDSDSDGDSTEGPDSQIAMVPVADLLNARFGSENSKLFYQDRDLKMISTKPIRQGDQIWNTYDDLGNGELLRRYGHVDLLPLPQGGEGNPGDVVEVPADLIVAAISQLHPSITRDSTDERIDWWLDEGGDDVVVLESDLELPEILVSLARLFTLTSGEWTKARSKGKPPKPVLDTDILDIIANAVQRRLERYKTSIEEDRSVLLDQGLSRHKRHAVIVRVGEKTILYNFFAKLHSLRKRLAQGEVRNKRKAQMALKDSVGGKLKK